MSTFGKRERHFWKRGRTEKKLYRDRGRHEGALDWGKGQETRSRTG